MDSVSTNSVDEVPSNISKDSKIVNNTTSAATGGEGYFAENYKQLIKAQREIDEVVEQLNLDQVRMTKAFKK